MADLLPRVPIAVRYRRDGQDFWIEGFEIFDPLMPHCFTKGGGGRFAPLKAKKRPSPDEVLIIRAGQRGRPRPAKLTDIVPIEEGRRYHSFAEVFGVAQTGGLTLDVERDVVEDLRMGEDAFRAESEEESGDG